MSEKKGEVRTERTVRIHERLLWTIDDVAVMTGLSESTIRRLRDRGEFPAAVKIGVGRVRWSADSIREWVKRRAS